jgi:hypothetical protein
MSEAFYEASKYEEIAKKELLPWLEKQLEHIQSMDRNYTDDNGARTLQLMAGDFLMHRKNGGGSFFAELKAEWSHTGNLFLETWSNKPFRVGWMYHNHADRLFYYFCELKKLYVLDFPALKQWAFADNRIYQLNEVEQTKYDQPNKTFGRLAWIPMLFNEMPEGAIRHFAQVDGRWSERKLEQDEWWKADRNFRVMLAKREEIDNEIPF